MKQKQEKKSNPQLTKSNVVKQAILFRSQKGIHDTDLGQVLKEMVNDGWDPSYNLLCLGVSTIQYENFRKKCNLIQPYPKKNWTRPCSSTACKLKK